jgi:molybdate transport system substrate-binding protein
VVTRRRGEHYSDRNFSKDQWTMTSLFTAAGASPAACIAASATVLVALLGGPNQARSAEIKLLSAAVMQPAFKETIDEFERASGHKLIITYRTMGAITERMLGGETADLVIGSTPSISRLVKEGKIDAESLATIAKVGVGIVVPSGTPKPRVASVDDLRRALLAAKTVVYADPVGGGAAGIHVAQVIEKLGLSEQLKSKTKFGAGGDVTEVTLAQGDGALGMTQISEIAGKPGASSWDRCRMSCRITPASRSASRPAPSRRRRSPRSSSFCIARRPLPHSGPRACRRNND